MAHWKLMFKTIPFVIVIAVAKLFLSNYIGFEGFVDFADVSMLLTAGIFLVGFMLAGTMADYKESERLPGEVACCLETIEETFTQASRSKPGLDSGALRRSVLAATDGIHSWFFKEIDTPALHRVLEQLAGAIGELESAGATPLGVRALNEMNALRKALTRVNVISRTGFLKTGYAILEVLIVIIIAILMISKFKSQIAEAILSFFVPLIYIYLVWMIHDIDDPFEHHAGVHKSADEIDLFPIEEYRRRLKDRC